MKRLCPRCQADLCIKSSWFGLVKHYNGKCPNCGLRYAAFVGGLVWIRAGGYDTPDVEEAEKLAKEAGEDWPEWPKKAAPEDGSAK